MMLLEELLIECDGNSRRSGRQRAAILAEVRDELALGVLLVVKMFSTSIPQASARQREDVTAKPRQKRQHPQW